MQREPGRRCYRACRTIEAPGRAGIARAVRLARATTCARGGIVSTVVCRSAALLDPAHFHARMHGVDASVLVVVSVYYSDPAASI